MRLTMANESPSRPGQLDESVTRGTENVFADLGYADAGERQTKLRLAYAINEIIASKRLNQTDAAERLGVGQPKISTLAHYKLDGFSVERLMTFLPAPNRSVEPPFSRKRRPPPPRRAPRPPPLT